jgi:hypothetical protein
VGAGTFFALSCSLARSEKKKREKVKKRAGNPVSEPNAARQGKTKGLE